MDKDVDAMNVKLGAKTYKGVPPCNEVIPFTRNSHSTAVEKGELLAKLQEGWEGLKRAMDKAKATKKDLQKDAKQSGIPKDIAKKFDAAIKHDEKVLKEVPKALADLQKLQKQVAGLKVGKQIPHALDVKAEKAVLVAGDEGEDAEKARQEAKGLHQAVLDNKADKKADALDKQADQYAAAQAAATKKAEAAAKAKKEAEEAAGEEKKKAEEAAAKAKAAAEAAAAKAKKQEEEKKAAEAAAQKASQKACAAQLKNLPCGVEWAFVTDSKGNLLAIKKGPKTGSGKTEVHRLTAASNYKKFDLHTATGLHLTDKNWDFVMDSQDNLVCILKGPKTGSGKTEVHRLSAASNYKQFNLQTGTGLQYADENWAFAMDSKDRLVCILKGPSGSGKTEVHRLTASSNYKSFDLHTATGLDYTNNADWDFAMDSEDNLACILKGPTSGSGKTEVHKLSGSSSFKKFNLHTATALHYSKGWAFAMVKNDVLSILKGPASGTCMTEVHKLSGSSNYDKFSLQTGTGLELSSTDSCAR